MSSGHAKAAVPAARKAFLAPDTSLHFSAASIWKIVIKNGLGRTDLAVDARVLRRGLFDNGYVELPISGEHALAVDQLPPIHKDPFDRMLLAQATTRA